MMNNIKNIRWLLILMLATIGLLAYADLTGWRFFSPNTSQQWNASGPGSHK